jgi:hypothetical protein
MGVSSKIDEINNILSTYFLRSDIKVFLEELCVISLNYQKYNE